MNRFEIQITYRADNGEPRVYEKIQGTELLKLVAQFMLILVRVQETFHQDEIEKLRVELIDDDIPF